MTRLIRTIMVVLFLAVSAPLVTALQATPLPGEAPECTADPVLPGTPVSIEELLAGGTASADVQANAPRIPRIAIDVPPPAPPYDAVVIDGTPADEETTIRVQETINNLFVCLWIHHSLGFATLVTPEYLRAAFGTDNPYNAVMPLEGYPEVTLRSVDDVLVHEDGRLSADVVVVYHDTQVYRFRAMLIAVDDQLLLDEEIPLPFDNADVMVNVLLDDTGLAVEPEAAPVSTLIAFDVHSDLDSLVTVSLIRIPESLEESSPVTDPGVVERSAYMNSVLVTANGRASFAVADLQPGTYTLVAVFENADGEPTVPQDGFRTFMIQ